MQRTAPFWLGVKRTLIALSEGTAQDLTLHQKVERIPETGGWSVQELVNHYRLVCRSPVAREDEILHVASLLKMVEGDRIYRIATDASPPPSQA